MLEQEEVAARLARLRAAKAAREQSTGDEGGERARQRQVQRRATRDAAAAATSRAEEIPSCSTPIHRLAEQGPTGDAGVRGE